MAGSYCDPLLNPKLKVLNASPDVMAKAKQMIVQRLEGHIKDDNVQI